MNYKEARDYLKQVNKFGSILGLDSIKRLLAKLGNPEKDLNVVHIAGTNGKGSTAAFLQRILMEAGYSVGRYSSPAVFDYREIIRINDNYIEKDALAKIVTLIKEKNDEIVNEGFGHPTSFEVETAMALLYFKEKKCDIVIIECGMGGETDATNVFEKVLCSIITTVSLDHTQFLGENIEKITRVKAGIIKENCPVVMSYQSSETLDIVHSVARANKSQMIVCGKPHNIKTEEFKTYFEYKASDGNVYHIKLNAMGTYQIANSVTALEAALILEQQGFKLKSHIQNGLLKTIWSGRMEIISHNPMIVIDGAHNPGAVRELRNSIDLYFTNKRITFIMGVLADKDFSREAEIIADKAVKIITITPDNPRALDGKQLAATLSLYNSNVQSADSLEEALHMAKETINNNSSDMILAFGSLSYLKEFKINNE